jgi:hypothetical protein
VFSSKNKQKPKGRYNRTFEIRSPRPARAHDSSRNASKTPPRTASGLKLKGYNDPYAINATTPIKSQGMILLPAARGIGLGYLFLGLWVLGSGLLART